MRCWDWTQCEFWVPSSTLMQVPSSEFHFDANSEDDETKARLDASSEFAKSFEFHFDKFRVPLWYEFRVLLWYEFRVLFWYEFRVLNHISELETRKKSELTSSQKKLIYSFQFRHVTKDDKTKAGLDVISNFLLMQVLSSEFLRQFMLCYGSIWYICYGKKLTERVTNCSRKN